LSYRPAPLPSFRAFVLGMSSLLLMASLALFTSGARGDGPKAETLRIHVLNVGQGDATIIEGPRDSRGDRKVLIYDAGESGDLGNEARHVIEPYLRKNLDDGPARRPVINVDYLIPSHYHKDHTGSSTGKEWTGLFYLWDALNVRIGRLLDTGINYDAGGAGDESYRKWVDQNQVRRSTLAFDQLGKDRQIDLGEDAWVEVLAVGARVEGRGSVLKERDIGSTSQNDFSAVLVLHYKKFDIYLGGDLSGYLHESWGSWYHNIEGATFAHLRPVEVYRVNHHGSQWSSSYPFLQRIKPSVSVISCGRGHRHPNEYTVQRLLGWEDYWTGRPVGSDIFQTKNDDGFLFDGVHPHTGRTQRVADGHIVIESDGETSFSVTLPGQLPFVYPLDPYPAYTDVPDSVRQARLSAAQQVGGEADMERGHSEVYDREDVKSGRVHAPRVDDPEGGGD
jgi:beta-lactamase superfamily II metal-dependent hydrolase